MVIDSFVSADESLYFDALSGAVFHAVLVVLEFLHKQVVSLTAV